MKETKSITLKVLSLFPKIDNILANKNWNIEEKSGIGNFVTSVDKKLENYLKTNISNIFPDAQIVSEESSDNTKNANASLKFIIDPLDGTTNYTNNWPYTVSIGIINNNELVGGIIYDALNKTIYTGIKDYGVTYCNIQNITDQKLIKPTTYPTSEIKKAVISYDTPYGKDAFQITQKMYAELYNSGASLKTVGPISLDVLKTALGKENRPHDYNLATWHTEVRAWDLAAATCILRELGGEIIGKDGKPLSIKTLSSPTEKIAFIACGNEHLRSQLFSKFEKAYDKFQSLDEK